MPVAERAELIELDCGQFKCSYMKRGIYTFVTDLTLFMCI